MASSEGKKYTYDHMDAETLERVKRELNENPETVHAHIESFRRWVKSMKHLTCPTDDEFLLRFLRVAKFDHSKAQKRLDNFCTVRSSAKQGFPEWFKPIDPDDPIVEEVLKLRQNICLGHVGDMPLTILYVPKLWDPEKIPFETVLPIMFGIFDCLIANERVQTHGQMGFANMDGVGMKQLSAWGNKTHFKKMATIWQDAYPIRIKDTFYYKEPVVMDIMFKMMEFFLDKKIMSRLHRIQSDLGKFYSRYPQAKSLMPIELEGTAGTFEEVSEKWIKTVKEFLRKGNPFAGIAVDESKRPATALKYMRQYGEYKGESFETKGTYTKLNV